MVEVAPFDDVFNDDVVELERVDDGVVVLRLQLVVAGVGLTCVDLVQLSYLGRNNVQVKGVQLIVHVFQLFIFVQALLNHADGHLPVA